MKRVVSILSLVVMILTVGLVGEAKTTKKKSSHSAPRGEFIKTDVITGDFDGDGKMDGIWTEGRYDDEGYAIGKIKLCSDNPKLAQKLSWDGLMGVELINLGKLAGSNTDLLGVIPYGMSTWCMFNTYKFNNSNWVEVLEPFEVWTGDEDSPLGVVPARSGKDGFVGIYYNDGDDFDESFERKYKEVKINF